MSKEIRIGLGASLPAENPNSFTLAAEIAKILESARAAIVELGVAPIFSQSIVSPRGPKQPAQPAAEPKPAKTDADMAAIASGSAPVPAPLWAQQAGEAA